MCNQHAQTYAAPERFKLSLSEYPLAKSPSIDMSSRVKQGSVEDSSGGTGTVANAESTGPE